MNHLEDFGPQNQPAQVDPAQPIPHVVAWNLTRRCNLACSHCYISAGPWQSASGELTKEMCARITDEILSINPAPLFILTGGEPLLRTDLEDIASYASNKGATVVVATNGTGLTAHRIASLKAAGVTGMAVSVDSLDPERHNAFRHGSTAFQDTIGSIELLREAELDFIIQTTLTRQNRHEIADMVAWAAEKGAVSFNLYFLVETGRGRALPSLSPEDNEAVLLELVELQRIYRGRIMIRSKCQPQLMRHIYERDPQSPLLNYSTRCPCGEQYCRITPTGKLTPCPYLPQVAGDLHTQSFTDIWRNAPLLQLLRSEERGGRCGRCEYRVLCGGCRARAYADSRDPLGPDDACAYEPDGEKPLVRTPRATTYGMSAAPVLSWSPAAEARMKRIPSFVRGVVVRRVEDYATTRGEDQITIDLLNRVRAELPIDFSKQRPFFLRNRDEDT